MKKLFALLVALVLIPCCMVAESPSGYEIHKAMKDYETRDLVNLDSDIKFELEYRSGKSEWFGTTSAHEAYKDIPEEELLALLWATQQEAKYRTCFINRMDYAVENSGFFLPEDVTCDLIRLYFEDNGFTVENVRKDDAMDNGMERYIVLLVDDSIIVRSINGLIRFYYNYKWFDDIPLY